MLSYIARQPIFDRELNVVAYELLFRSGEENVFLSDDPTAASSSVLADSFFEVGLPKLTNNKLAFINFTRDLLLRNFAELFPCDSIVIEILEDIEPDEQVIRACHELRQAGYFIALDDFQYEARYDPLIDIANIIKVDFSLSDRSEQAWMASTFKPLGLKMLAEKVETREEFDQALAMGYDYFQGYFFSKPVIIASERLPDNKITSLQLLKEVTRPVPDLDTVETIIKTDVSLTYRLLRYINSAFFGVRHEVHSIRQALTLLGDVNIRKWSTLVGMACLSSDKPHELIRTSLIRGKLCEEVSQSIGCKDRDQDLFLLGMFSLLDAMSGQSMDLLLKDIPLPEDIKDILLGGRKVSKIGKVLDLVHAYEEAHWQRVTGLAGELGIDADRLPGWYLEAVEWTGEIMNAGVEEAAT